MDRPGLMPTAALLAVALSASSAFAAGGLELRAPSEPLRLGAASSPIALRRDATSGALTVHLSSSSTAGELNPSGREPGPAWVRAIDVTLADGAAEAVFFYRDGAPGTPTLTAQAPGLTDATVTVEVNALAISDGFETGTLFPTDQPPGPWNTSWFPSARNTLAPSALAAHRGQFGLRLTDTDDQAGPGGQNTISCEMAPVAGELHLRFWFRLSAASQLQDLAIMQVSNGTGDNDALVELMLKAPAAFLWVGGYSGVSTFTEAPTALDLSVGSWHLIETRVTGLGTQRGTRAVWVDGLLRATQSGLDWSAPVWRAVRFHVGEPWAERPFTGQLDFDDVRASKVPLPSRLALSLASGPKVAGACLELSLGLESSATEGPAPAPELVEASLSDQDAPGEFYRDSACDHPTSTASIARGDTSVSLYYRGAAGTVDLGASNLDGLPAELSLELSPAARAILSQAALNVDPGELFVLDGSTSTPSAGAELVEFTWSEPEGPTGVRLGTEPRQALTLEAPGDYRFWLVVRDSAGSRSEAAEARVHVTGSPMHPDSKLGCSNVGSSGVWNFLLVLAALAHVRLRHCVR